MLCLILILINYSGHCYAARYTDGPGALCEGSSNGLGSPDSLRYDDCSAWQIVCDSTQQGDKWGNLRWRRRMEMRKDEWDGDVAQTQAWKALVPSGSPDCTCLPEKLWGLLSQSALLTKIEGIIHKKQQ